MRLILVIPFAFAISSALVGASAVVSRGLPEGCGPTSQVLAHTTIDHKNGTLDYVTGTCTGGSSGDSTKRSDLEGRQQVCTSGYCSVVCKELSAYNIYVDDCVYVIDYIDYLGSYPPISFTLPAQQYAYWSYGTCTVTIVNLDRIAYDVCYATLAYEAALIVNDCVGITAGGVCDGSQTYGQAYEIAVS